ncbi:MAG: diaminopimelate dehydrogenase [Eubacterium sp.]|nr:diaminopimelate dehydrogenase [Eubacterium sp.]
MRIGIIGYGNLGRGAEAAISHADDMELVAVFTRRDPETLKIRTESAEVCSFDSIADFAGKIDVMILCAGSATDLPEMTPEVASEFNVVDSFDTHARIPEHFADVDRACKAAGTTALISAGWDPGLFSIARVIGASVLPEGKDYTFWGRGVSQGHSDAVRRINGVLDARQYTNPVPEAMDRVRAGEDPELTTREKHTREVYVVAEDGADKALIEKEIKVMPNYFSDYDTTVTFITQEEMDRDHAGLPHGGSVIRSGRTGYDLEMHDTYEFKLDLDSNPMFTGSILVAYARAIKKMNDTGHTGCKTVLDIPPALLSPLSSEDLRAHML